jgi:ABC-type branched-subunit amino acid transport system substrate-binding protein
MQRAGTVTDGRRIRDALAALDHQGVIGRIRFDENRQANPPVFVTQWCADGRRRILFPAAAVGDCGTG